MSRAWLALAVLASLSDAHAADPSPDDFYAKLAAAVRSKLDALVASHAPKIVPPTPVKLQWKPKKSTEAPFDVDVPDLFTQAFVMEKDSSRFPNTGGWGYALFDYDAPSDRFTVDPTGVADCGQACHVAVKAKDYIFHPYQKR